MFFEGESKFGSKEKEEEEPKPFFGFSSGEKKEPKPFSGFFFGEENKKNSPGCGFVNNSSTFETTHSSFGTNINSSGFNSPGTSFGIPTSSTFGPPPSGFGTNTFPSGMTTTVESELKKYIDELKISSLKNEHTKIIELLKNQHQKEIESLKKTTVPPTKIDFSSFVANPMKYFSQDFKEKKEHIQEFYKIYKSFCTGGSNQHLLSLLIKKMKSGNFNDLYPDSFFRENSKELFISTLFQAKENNSWSKELRMKCRKLDEMVLEKNENLKELEIYKLVFEKLFEEWVKGTSNFMQELDSKVEFKKNLSDSVISAMLKTLNERTKPELIFTEIEETFNNLKLMKSLKYGSEFDLFVQMNSKLTSTTTELKSEIQRKDSEIKELKLEMERLNSIIRQNVKLNPDLPHDMVYFQYEE
jgi:hypothetical protein